MGADYVYQHCNDNQARVREQIYGYNFPGIRTVAHSLHALHGVRRPLSAEERNLFLLRRAETENEIRRGKLERVKNFKRCADMH